jgi:hypothetical protein
MSIVMDIRRAISAVCMKANITDTTKIRSLTVQAMGGLGEMSIPAYKAHNTMRKQRKNFVYHR